MFFIRLKVYTINDLSINQYRHILLYYIKNKNE